MPKVDAKNLVSGWLDPACPVENTTTIPLVEADELNEHLPMPDQPVPQGIGSRCRPHLGEAETDINGEFDPGSGRTLAACLTHASRTVKPLRGWISGERVSNT